nr:hypothetical protein [uncultured Holophaga sp.]
MFHRASVFIALGAVSLAARAPLEVGTPLPALLDLRDARAGDLVPRDGRDPAQVEACRRAWLLRVRPLAGAEARAMIWPCRGVPG